MAKINWIYIDGKPLETEDIKEVTLVIGPRHKIKVSRGETDRYLVEMSAIEHGIKFEVGDKVPTELDKIIKRLQGHYPEKRAD